MSKENTDSKSNTCVVENTRRIIVHLANGVSPERFVKLLNERYVCLKGEELTDAETGEVLGQRPAMLAANTTDYRLAASQAPTWELDTLDPFDYKFNEI
jgi:hypothetical protein